MKRKSKRKMLRKKKEFRYHNIETLNSKGKKIKIRHPTYVFLEKGNVYIYVSITHSNKLKDTFVIKLRKNPNPKDKRLSYRVSIAQEDTKDSFGRRQINWKMDPEDDNDIREEYKKR